MRIPSFAFELDDNGQFGLSKDIPLNQWVKLKIKNADFVTTKRGDKQMISIEFHNVAPKLQMSVAYRVETDDGYVWRNTGDKGVNFGLLTLIKLCVACGIDANTFEIPRDLEQFIGKCIETRISKPDGSDFYRFSTPSKVGAKHQDPTPVVDCSKPAYSGFEVVEDEPTPVPVARKPKVEVVEAKVAVKKAVQAKVVKPEPVIEEELVELEPIVERGDPVVDAPLFDDEDEDFNALDMLPDED